MASTTPLYKTKKLPTIPPANIDDGGGGGPSWGLIIPIILIGLFLISVGVCLWWHKWRDKRTLHVHRSSSGSSFQRSYRRSRTNRSYVDAIRDSTRSTTPLRSSINEKIANNNNKAIKVNNVNVTPVKIHLPGTGKFSFHWEKNHWKGYPAPFTNSMSRSGTKPLSPINEIDSPASMQLSERSHNTYDVRAAEANYHQYYNMGWYTPANKHYTYEHSEQIKPNRPQRYPNKVRISSGDSENLTPYQGYEPAVNSPFFPNNNTPTTECDTGSEASNMHHSSQFTSYPSSPKSTARSDSNPVLSLSTETDTNRTSYTTSYGQETFQSSHEHSHSGLAPSSTYPSSTFPSGETSHTNPSTNYSSLPSSIAPFSKQNVHEDINNNSMLVPSAYLNFPNYPGGKGLDYTLASSVASSDTHVTDNTSLHPNVGSSNTSCYPSTLASRQHSMEPSGHVSPEDLSKLVDEMSSIRPVEESSIRPNSSLDPSTRIMTISGTSVTPDLHQSWSVLLDRETRGSVASVNTSSQNGSMFWDNYPLNQTDSKSFQDINMHDSLVQQAQLYGYHAPVLMETQYWV